MSFEAHVSHEFCVWMMSLVIVMFGVTINLLVALSVDRYWAICHPMSYFVVKNAGFKKWIIVSCVALGVVLGSLPALGWSNSSIYSCYVVDVLSFGFMFLCCLWTLGSTLLIIILYGLIYKEISEHVST